jgi:hypothetical protein
MIKDRAMDSGYFSSCVIGFQLGHKEAIGISGGGVSGLIGGGKGLGSCL